MAFVLKEPHGKSKGIVIFTHKERKLFNNAPDALKRIISQAKDHYVFGMHFGFYNTDVDDIPFIDFFMSSPHTLELSPNTTTPLIPLCSRDFIPDFFAHNSQQPKNWDILCIANTNKRKCLDEFMYAMKKLLQRRPNTTILLITYAPDKPRPKPKYDLKLREKYESTFTEKEKDQFDFIFLKTLKSGFPITQRAMPFFFNASRVFTLFSYKEGHARVITEALLCGLPVVFKKHLKGGTKDYVNDKNGRLFSTSEEAVEHFIELLDTTADLPMEEEANKVAQQSREDYTLPKLKQELVKLFDSFGLPFEGGCTTDNLTRRLSSHTTELNRHMTMPHSDDIKNYYNLAKFLIALKGDSYDIALMDRIKLKIHDTKMNAKRKKQLTKKFVKNSLLSHSN